MNEKAYKLLSTNAKREIAVNAHTPNKKDGAVPEIFLSLPFNQEPPEAPVFESFAPGQKVRVLSMIHPIRTGVIVTIPNGMTILANGVSAKAAKVQFDDTSDEILVPLSNLQVLG
jgi:hypothetical protein